MGKLSGEAQGQIWDAGFIMKTLCPLHLFFSLGQVRGSSEISETGFTVSRPRSRFTFIESQFRDRDWDFFLVVSTTRLRPRLFFQSLNFETEIETFFFKFRDRDWDWDCHWSQNRDRDWDFFEILVHLWNSLSWVSCKFKMENIKWVYSLQKAIYTPNSSGHFQYLPWLDSIHV